jgi:hypothetical protein
MSTVILWAASLCEYQGESGGRLLIRVYAHFNLLDLGFRHALRRKFMRWMYSTGMARTLIFSS